MTQEDAANVLKSYDEQIAEEYADHEFYFFRIFTAALRDLDLISREQCDRIRETILEVENQ